MGCVRTDLAIIGAGPAGLYAAFEAGRHGMSAHIVDVMPRPGGQCAELYPEKPIYDIPALVSCTGTELIRNLLAQIERFKPAFHLGVNAVGLSRSVPSDRWSLSLSNGTVLDAGAVTIAAGAGSFEPRRLAVSGAERYEGTSLLYSVSDVELLRGKRVVVVGGGDSAVDWALALGNVASRVIVVHRRDAFRASPRSVEQLNARFAAGEADFVLGRVTALDGRDGRIEAIECESPAGRRGRWPCDVVLVFFGLTNRLGPILEWGLQSTMDRLIVDPATMETSLPAVFAIGDVADYPGKLKLILSGFHEAALMGHAVYKRLHGEAPRFEYSTHSKVLAAAAAMRDEPSMKPSIASQAKQEPPGVADHIVVVDRSGESHTVAARTGSSLLDLITAANIEIKGSCYGACNCSTCHVYVEDPWLSGIPGMLEQEQEVLDQVSAPMPNSRLACQIEYQPSMVGMRVRLSEDTRID